MLQKIPLLFPFLTTNQALLDREPFWEGKQDQEEMREELEKGGKMGLLLYFSINNETLALAYIEPQDNPNN